MKNVTSVSCMRKSDEEMIKNGVPARELMKRAALGIFNRVKWCGRVAIVCGSGNNAGDGYALALILKEHGVYCEIVLIKEKFSPDGKYYYEKCIESAIPCYIYADGGFSNYDMIVDCILGTGFSGEPRESEAKVIKAINASEKCIVSVDINSGLNADNGLCTLCVKSDITVSVGTLKTGHFLGMAKDNISEVINCDIGITLTEEPYKLIEAADVKTMFPKRASFSNKGTYGYITLIGGSAEYSGAAKLANMALSSLKVGGGVVRLAVPKSISAGVMPYLLESTLCPLNDADGAILFNDRQIKKALKGAKAVAIGMGMGERAQTYEIVKYILENYEIPVIIDADGLNAISKYGTECLKNTKCKVIMTPHPGEFARLYKKTVAEIENDPIRYSVEYARENSVVLLLKGPTTIVTDGEKVILSDTGCPGMATAGSGDVLSGILAGMCAANSTSGDMLLCVASGAYINGKAGEAAQAETNYVSMTSSDTVKCISGVISAVLNS